MQNLLLSCILLFSLTACGNSEEKAAQETKLAQEVQAQKDALLAELKAKDLALSKAREEARIAQEKLLAQEKARKEAFLEEEARKTKESQESLAHEARNQKLSKIGIELEEHKITIDTNKTKDFFQTLGKRVKNKLTKLSQDIEEGFIDEKNAGIKIDETHINIDLNKTKDFLELWGKKMQRFVKEFDAMSKEMNKSIQK